MGKLVVLMDSGSGPIDVSNYVMKFCIGTPTFNGMVASTHTVHKTGESVYYYYEG